MNTETVRKSVPLTRDELNLLETARNQGSPAYNALIELLGDDEATRSEAAILHAAITLGVATLRERISEKGYAALAAMQDDEDRAYHAAMRRRPRHTRREDEDGPFYIESDTWRDEYEDFATEYCD